MVNYKLGHVFPTKRQVISLRISLVTKNLSTTLSFYLFLGPLSFFFWSGFLGPFTSNFCSLSGTTIKVPFLWSSPTWLSASAVKIECFWKGQLVLDYLIPTFFVVAEACMHVPKLHRNSYGTLSRSLPSFMYLSLFHSHHSILKLSSSLCNIKESKFSLSYVSKIPNSLS